MFFVKMHEDLLDQQHGDQGKKDQDDAEPLPEPHGIKKVG